jgi:hypothetical protein
MKTKDKDKVVFSYKDILDANQLIGNFSNTKNFPVESMINLLDLKRELKEKSEKYQNVFSDIMTQYSVKTMPSVENPTQQVYSWAGHENATEITKKVVDLANATNELKHIQFLSPENFFQVTEGISMNYVEFLQKFLLKS